MWAKGGFIEGEMREGNRVGLLGSAVVGGGQHGGAAWGVWGTQDPESFSALRSQQPCTLNPCLPGLHHPPGQATGRRRPRPPDHRHQ